mgnify:FL=1
MKTQIVMTGMSKQMADNLINQTPIDRHERNDSRHGWSYTVLKVGTVRVGTITPCIGQSKALTVEIDLEALKLNDDHWITTLETLGILK